MTSDPTKCGLSSLLPMSCRERAEDFARHLHSRLRSLGSEGGNGATDESSWLAAPENKIAVSQPRHTTEADIYLDLDSLESPESPQEEMERSEFEKLLNKDNLRTTRNNDHRNIKQQIDSLSDTVRLTSNDSDSSDSQFYDTENEVEQRPVENGIHQENGVEEESEEKVFEENAETDSKNSNLEEEIFVTTSDRSLPHLSSSLSEDISTLSLQNDDSSSLTEITNSEEIIEDVASTPGDLNDNQNLETEQHNQEEVLEEPSQLTVVVSTSQVKLDSKELASRRTEDEEVEPEERTPRVRRCSSLKTGKTPPGTPGRKKIVRFADVLGLDLADVRTYINEIPKVPTSAYSDLKDVNLSESAGSTDNNYFNSYRVNIDKTLIPLFQQPESAHDFHDRIRDNQVCLESAAVEDQSLFSIAGFVRVRNLDFHKSVHIRYTLNSWQSFADAQAKYIENSCDGFSDRFSFLLFAHTLQIGQMIQFAVRFQCKGSQYWDNNKGDNYRFQCVPVRRNPVPDNYGADFYY